MTWTQWKNLPQNIELQNALLKADAERKANPSMQASAEYYRAFKAWSDADSSVVDEDECGPSPVLPPTPRHEW